MFEESVLSLIKKVLPMVKKETQKENDQGRKAIANQIIAFAEKVVGSTQKNHTPLIYVNDRKKTVNLINSSGEKFEAILKGNDTFDTYIGASLCLGYNQFKSRRKYYNELAKYQNEYLNGLEMPIEKISLLYQYNCYGGKNHFENTVNTLLSNSQKKSKKQAKNEEIETEEVETEEVETE